MSIVNDQNPGIQIVDLLLWATTRNYRSKVPEPDWYNRIRIGISARKTIPDDALSMSNFYVNRPISKRFNIFYNIPLLEIDEVEDGITEEQVDAIFLWAEVHPIILTTREARTVKNT